jgi:hypothetical protein
MLRLYDKQPTRRGLPMANPYHQPGFDFSCEASYSPPSLEDYLKRRFFSFSKNFLKTFPLDSRGTHTSAKKNPCGFLLR